MKLADVKELEYHVIEEDVDDPENISVLLEVTLKKKTSSEVPYLVVNFSQGTFYNCQLWNRNYDWLDEKVSKDLETYALNYVNKNVEL